MRKKMSILVVDDDRRMARTIADILTIKGYRAEAAHAGVEALEKVKKGCFDSILCCCPAHRGGGSCVRR